MPAHRDHCNTCAKRVDCGHRAGEAILVSLTAPSIWSWEPTSPLPNFFHLGHLKITSKMEFQSKKTPSKMLQIGRYRRARADKLFLLPLVREERLFPRIFSFKSVPCANPAMNFHFSDFL